MLSVYCLCRLSELLYLPLPPLPTTSQKTDSILIGSNNTHQFGEEMGDTLITSGGKWEDDEERRFFEDIQDLKDFIPRSVLGLEDADDDSDKSKGKESDEETERIEKEKVAEEVRKLEEELEGLKLSEEQQGVNGQAVQSESIAETHEVKIDEDEYVAAFHLSDQTDYNSYSVPTPTPGSPKTSTPPLSPLLAPQGPSQLLTALLARLPDATNRTLIDQASIDFAFLNSKAARKRLVKVNYTLHIFYTREIWY